MSADLSSPSTAHADLAYLKALAEGGSSRTMAGFGASYLFAGVAFGIQIVLQWLDYADILPLEGLSYLAVVSIPTIAFLTYLTWQSWRSRKERAANQASRAINAVFQGSGLVNAAVIAIVVAAASGLGPRGGIIILIYPAVLFAFQGACWFVVYRLRKRLWMLVVALAWIASGIAMGFALGVFNMHAYIAIATFDMWVLMALPGAVILHLARKASP